MNTGNLVWALQQLLRAEAEEREARDGYEGGSWGYHGHSFITASADAATKFEAELNAVIDARVAAALANRVA